MHHQTSKGISSESTQNRLRTIIIVLIDVCSKEVVHDTSSAGVYDLL